MTGRIMTLDDHGIAAKDVWVEFSIWEGDGLYIEGFTHDESEAKPHWVKYTLSPKERPD